MEVGVDGAAGVLEGGGVGSGSGMQAANNSTSASVESRTVPMIGVQHLAILIRLGIDQHVHGYVA